MKIAAIAFALGLAACTAKSTPPTDPVGTAPPSDPAPAQPLDLAALGSNCGDTGACPTGTTCVEYFGIAGPAGPKFASCEVTCAGGKGCPDGTGCVTIADGPGQVCRQTTQPTGE